jgi:hypothetical protein
MTRQQRDALLFLAALPFGIALWWSNQVNEAHRDWLRMWQPVGRAN